MNSMIYELSKSFNKYEIIYALEKKQKIDIKYANLPGNLIIIIYWTKIF